MNRTLIATILAGSVIVPATPASAEFFEGDDPTETGPTDQARAGLTANERVILDAFTSPMAFAKAIAFVGLEHDAEHRLATLRDQLLDGAATDDVSARASPPSALLNGEELAAAVAEAVGALLVHAPQGR